MIQKCILSKEIKYNHTHALKAAVLGQLNTLYFLVIFLVNIFSRPGAHKTQMKNLFEGKYIIY